MHALKRSEKVTWLPARRGYSICVALPLKTGPQAGVIRKNSRGAKATDVLVVLDASVTAAGGYPDPECSALLALGEAAYRKEIRRLRKSTVTGQKSRRMGQIKIVDRGRLSQPRWKEHLMIIRAWEEWSFTTNPWDNSRLTWRQRFEAHYANMHTPLPASATERRKAARKFRAKCRYIGLTTIE